MSILWPLSTNFSSEIGYGWRPAVLDTQEEYDFIREGQKSFNDSASYWIGGSTDSNGIFEYSDYIGNNSGSITDYEWHVTVTFTA